jgi:hypothetical protein
MPLMFLLYFKTKYTVLDERAAVIVSKISLKFPFLAKFMRPSTSQIDLFPVFFWQSKRYFHDCAFCSLSF